jgi:pimeloyl-ACP methyl ester carboxylesterase
MNIEKKTVDGVFIEYTRAEGDSSGPPMVFVHGGHHGSWAWENYLTYFAELGHDCYAFSWFNHHGSRELPDAEFATRSMVDTVQELETAVAVAGRVPILVTHSMGSLVGQKYAETHPVIAEVHITPAVCAEVGLHPDSEVDLSAPIDVPSFETAWPLYFPENTEADARRYHSVLSRESAMAIKETISTSFSVDRTRLGGPSLVIAAENDTIVPPEAIRRSAAHFGSDYLYLPGRTHNVLLEPRWREAATRIATWLDRQIW